jgi:hypothetical protein
MPSTRANVTATVGGNSFFAGKNKIINGAFDVWQRGTSISLTSGNSVYFADRFYGSCNFSAGTASFSQQTFTAGAAPVAGYEGQYFARLTCGSTSTHFSTYQKIEDVRTFAGTTATYSFWAKASTNVTVALYGVQNFGSGGSANVDVTISPSTAALTTSWQRFTATVTVPSISGKTIGTGSNLTIGYYYSSGTINSATIDLWGVQMEAGSVATAFQTATGTLQGELAACQRYYYRVSSGNSNNYAVMGISGVQNSTTTGLMFGRNPVTMRAKPTAIEYANLAVNDGSATDPITSLTINTDRTSDNVITCDSGNTAGTLTANRFAYIRGNNSTSAYFGVSAEL